MIIINSHNFAKKVFIVPFISFSFAKRFMLSSAIKRIPVQYKISIYRDYSTRNAYQFKGKAAKDLANDGTGKHTHIVEEKCAQTACESKKCPILCDTAQKFCVKGHNTHKPLVGRMARFIHDHDAKNEDKPQYYVPTNTIKEITEQQRQEYGKNIKPDDKQKTFIDDHYNKYD